MKRCPFCGAEIEYDARFCLYCMTSLDEKQYWKPKKHTKKRWQPILAAVFVVSLAACILLASPTPSSVPSVVPTDNTTTTDTVTTTDISTTLPPTSTLTTAEAGSRVTDSTLTTAFVTTTIKNRVTTAVTTKKATTTTENRASVTTIAPTTSGNASSNGLTRDEVVAKMPANLKNTKIVYLDWYNPHQHMEGAALKEFKQKTGIELVYEAVSAGAFGDELISRVTSGSAPDMVCNRFTSVYAMRGLQPIENSGFDFNDPVWDNEIMDLYTFKGRRYGMNIQNSANLNVNVMYYNRKLITDGGFEDPYALWQKGQWTWEKFWELCEAFVQSKDGQSGYYGATFEYGADTYALTRTKDFVYFNHRANKYVNNMNDPEIINAYTAIREQIEKGLVSNDFRLSGFEDHKMLFLSSGSFVGYAHNTRLVPIKKRNRLGTVPMPTDETTKYTLLHEATAYGIPIGAINAAAVPYLVRYITDPESYDMSEVYCDEQARIAAKEMISRGNFTVPKVAEHITGRADNPVRVDLLSDDLKTELKSKTPAVNETIENANRLSPLISYN